MTAPANPTDRDFAAILYRLVDGTLDPHNFDHRDHIGVAFEALARHEFFEAAHMLSDGLRGMAAQAGVPEKFNATMTMAYLSLIAEHMHDGDFKDANAFLRENPDILDRNALAPWYTKEQLNASVSKVIPVLPPV